MYKGCQKKPYILSGHLTKAPAPGLNGLMSKNVIFSFLYEQILFFFKQKFQKFSPKQIFFAHPLLTDVFAKNLRFSGTAPLNGFETNRYFFLSCYPLSGQATKKIRGLLSSLLISSGLV